MVRTETHMPSDIAENIAKVQQRIRAACAKVGRKEAEVTLVGVAKTHSAGAIRQAFANGVDTIGESYWQEAQLKMAQLQDLPITWHFLGPLQSNKTRAIAGAFDWVHSLDRLALAERLASQRPAHLAPLNVCLQVNISAESTKAGVALNAVAELAAAVAQLPNLTLRGLMAIPEPSTDPKVQQRAFAQLRGGLESLRERWPQMDTLSMGMSQDLEAAIAEGTTHVRIGTAIFGERPARTPPSPNTSEDLG